MLSSLGVLDFKRGRFESARLNFATAKAIFHEIGNPFGLASVLAQRARLEQSVGELERARVCVDEAESLAGKAGAGPDSELGRTLAEARGLLDTWRRRFSSTP